MFRSRPFRLLLALLAVLLVAASCSSRDDSDDAGGGGGGTETTEAGESGGIDTADCPPDTNTAGIDGDTITLASSFPQSGLTAAFSEISKGYKAYFQMVNEEEGGVDIAGKKYKIEVKDKDDEYNASKTVQNINDLVGTDGTGAFAVFNVVGTANNIAIREKLNELCVPQIFAATGAPAWGNPEFPWLMGSTLAAYSLEGQAFAEYLKEKKPDATVAMLVQNDEFGQDYEQGFKRAIDGTDIKVVKVEKYATGSSDVNAQVTSLAATKADAFFDGATLLACPNALQQQKAANWDAITWVSGTCISKTLMGIAGQNADKVISASNVQDPQNPAYADLPEMKDYKAKVKQYQPDADVENGIVAYGWTQGALLVETLKGLDTLGRAELMNALHAMDGVEGGLLIPDVSVTTDGEEDPFMGETLQTVQYDAAAKHFNNVGEPLDYEGKTLELTPENLVTG
jgi:branched-chain amino acid transport system substrate-binding protein